MSPDTGYIFSEDNIQRLFGNEAGENEDPARLRQYYFKSSTYDRILGSSPLRILVGHKGIGKSALFKVAIAEQREASNLAILIRPDEVATIATETKPFLELISDWKMGLRNLIRDLAMNAFGGEGANQAISNSSKGLQILEFIRNSVPSLKKHISLDKAKERLINSFLSDSKITVFIDDLDRGWEAKTSDIKRISALLNAARDLASENEGLKFRIALRSDVYFLVRTSDESTDKVEGSVIWHVWSNHEILVMLVKRILTFFQRHVNDAEFVHKSQLALATYLSNIMDPIFRGKGQWAEIPIHRVLMSLIRKRPRDLVKLCTLAARNAAHVNRSKLSSEDFSSAFVEYSQGRIQDTINEYRSELPLLKELLFAMRPTTREVREKPKPFVYNHTELLKKISDIRGRHNFVNSLGRKADAKELAYFLYKINFLQARKTLPNGKIHRAFFEEQRYLAEPHSGFSYDWEIHPAYRWVLQPEWVGEILSSMENWTDSPSGDEEN